MKRLQLGKIVEDDIRVIRVVCEEVLVIGFGRIKPLERGNFGNDRRPENAGFVQLGDIGKRQLLLRFVGIENRRTVLGPLIRTLAIELCWIVRDGEENPQKVFVRNLGRVEGDLH